MTTARHAVFAVLAAALGACSSRSGSAPDAAADSVTDSTVAPWSDGSADAIDAVSSADAADSFSAESIERPDEGAPVDTAFDPGEETKPLYVVCAPPVGGTCPDGCKKVYGHPMSDSTPACAQEAELLFCVDYAFVDAIVKCRFRKSTSRIYLFPSWAPAEADDPDWRPCTKDEQDKSPPTFCK
jgi:hypothetical protein